jgi:hypothetical protein
MFSGVGSNVWAGAAVSGTVSAGTAESRLAETGPAAFTGCSQGPGAIIGPSGASPSPNENITTKKAHINTSLQKVFMGLV